MRGSGREGAPGSGSARRHVSRTISTGPAAGGSSNSSSSEALLVILDQVASLRAIGSATHPAIAETLHKHEAQLAELREAQQGIHAAISALTGDADVTKVFSTAVLSGPVNVAPAGADTEPAAEPASSSAAAEVATDGGSAQGAAADSSSPAVFEGEAAHRLADLESRLAAGLKVLAAVRGKLSPLQEVADATQSMMRELQVRPPLCGKVPALQLGQCC
jgi:hypothetical protein